MEASVNWLCSQLRRCGIISRPLDDDFHRFMDLPAELRGLIYEFYFRGGFCRANTKHSHALLLTCRDIRHHGLQVLYNVLAAHCEWSEQSRQRWRHWQVVASTMYLKHLRTVRISVSRKSNHINRWEEPTQVALIFERGKLQMRFTCRYMICRSTVKMIKGIVTNALMYSKHQGWDGCTLLDLANRLISEEGSMNYIDNWTSTSLDVPSMQQPQYVIYASYIKGDLVVQVRIRRVLRRNYHRHVTDKKGSCPVIP